jgi:ribonuclease HI
MVMVKAGFDASQKRTGRRWTERIGYWLVGKNINITRSQKLQKVYKKRTTETVELKALHQLCKELSSRGIENASIQGDNKKVIELINGPPGPRENKLLRDTRRYFQKNHRWFLRWEPRERNSLANSIARLERT